MEAELYKLIFSHQTISNANEYASFIDRTLNNFFVKGDEIHLVLDVKRKGKIPPDDFYGFGDIFKIVKDFCESENIDNQGELSIKSNVQSDGLIEIIKVSVIPLSMMALGLILQALAGGKFSAGLKANNKTGLDVSATSDVPVGLIDQFRKYMRSRSEDKIRAKIVEKSLENMKIDAPEDLVKMIDKAIDRK